MPRSRLTSAETAAIKARLLAGESVAAVARSMGRSRQALSRIKGSLDRKEVRRLSVKLNIRITEDEHAAFQAVAEASGLTVSEAVRHLVRQASDRLAIQADELDAIVAARRELSAVGNNLNQIARNTNRGMDIDVPQLRDALHQYHQVIAAIYEALGMEPARDNQGQEPGWP